MSTSLVGGKSTADDKYGCYSNFSYITYMWCDNFGKLPTSDIFSNITYMWFDNFGKLPASAKKLKKVNARRSLLEKLIVLDYNNHVGGKLS